MRRTVHAAEMGDAGMEAAAGTETSPAEMRGTATVETTTAKMGRATAAMETAETAAAAVETTAATAMETAAATMETTAATPAGAAMRSGVHRQRHQGRGQHGRERCGKQTCRGQLHHGQHGTLRRNMRDGRDADEALRSIRGTENGSRGRAWSGTIM